MRPLLDRRFVPGVRLAVILLALTVPASAQGQSQHGPVPGPAGPSNKTWTPKLTPDGQPDIQGVWTNFDPTPFETPGEDDATRLAALRRWFPPDDPVTTPPRPAAPRATREVSGFADGPVGAPRNARRRSMVIDPPSGRAPVRPEAAAKRDDHLTHLTDSWEHHTPWERCITRGVPAGIFPPGYGAGYRILQVTGYVVILYEMIHEARFIPVDGSPHVPSGIRLWNGDSRGRWEGNTLVVETTNFTDQTRFRNSTRDLHLIERFTRVDPQTLIYEFTVDDPLTFTRPWRASIPMTSTEGPLFEYACHEGNYGLEGMLSGARVQEKALR